MFIEVQPIFIAQKLIAQFSSLVGTLDERPFSELLSEFAEKYDILPSTLQSAVTRFDPSFSPPHGHTEFNPRPELVIVAGLLVRSRLRASLSKKDALVIVNKLFYRRLSRGWLATFLQRYPTLLQLCKTGIVTKSRLSSNMLAEVTDFYDTYEYVLDHHQVSAKNLINIDECRLAMRRDGQTGVSTICGVADEPRNTSVTTDSTVLTLLPFVTAEGRCVCVFVVLRAPKHVPEGQEFRTRVVLPTPEHRTSVRRSNMPWPFVFVATRKGYLNKESYKVVMDQFIAIWQNAHPGLNAFVLADQLDCHKDVDTVEYLARQGVFTVLFAPNTSHFVQPLDGEIFGQLKRVFRQSLGEYALDSALEHESAAEPVWTAMYEACAVAFTPETIARSFRSRGVWPFDRDLILQHAKRWAGTQTNDSATAMEVNRFVQTASAIQSKRRAENVARYPATTTTFAPLTPKTPDQIRDANRRAQELKEEAAATKSNAKEEKKKAHEQKRAEKERVRVLKMAARACARDERMAEKKCRGKCGKGKRGVKYLVCVCSKYFICCSCNKNKLKAAAFRKHKKECRATFAQ